MSELKILVRLAELPRAGTLFRHHKGGLVQVTGCGWDAARDVAQVQYRHVKADYEGELTSEISYFVKFGLSPNVIEYRLSGPTWHHDYTAEGWLRIESGGVRRFEEVKG